MKTIMLTFVCMLISNSFFGLALAESPKSCKPQAGLYVESSTAHCGLQIAPTPDGRSLFYKMVALGRIDCYTGDIHFPVQGLLSYWEGSSCIYTGGPENRNGVMSLDGAVVIYQGLTYDRKTDKLGFDKEILLFLKK